MTANRVFSPERLQFTAQPQDTAVRVEITPQDKLHQFDIGVAATHGITAAAVYRYIQWHCQRAGKWVGSMDALLKTFPYLSRKELRLVLSKLLGLRRGYKRLLRRAPTGFHYAYVLAGNPGTEGKMHSFDPQMAKLYGALAAVIYDNVVYWISEEEFNGNEPEHYASPRVWQEQHPYASLRSVERAFNELQMAGELVMKGYRAGRIPVWTIPLGVGKLDRWCSLHSKVRKTPSKPTTIYVPVLADKDIY